MHRHHNANVKIYVNDSVDPHQTVEKVFQLLSIYTEQTLNSDGIEIEMLFIFIGV